MKQYSTLLATAGSLVDLESIMAEVNAPGTNMRAKTFRKCQRNYYERKLVLMQARK